MIKKMATAEDMMKKAPEGTYIESLLKSFENINSYFVKSDTYSIQFTSTEGEMRFSKHAHVPQWTYVFKGEATFSYEDGRIETYKEEDTYFIPNDIAHESVLSEGYMDVTVLLLDPSLIEKV